jgi:hypothetical protein
MAKAKKGDKLSCTVCGLVVAVDEVCGCASTAILCCGKPMGKGKPTAKAGKKAAPVAAKPVKAAAKAKAGGSKTTVAAKKAPAKAVAAKPKAAPKKAPAKKLPAPKK